MEKKEIKCYATEKWANEVSDYWSELYALIRDGHTAYHLGIYRWKNSLIVAPVSYDDLSSPFEICVYDFFEESSEIEEERWIEFRDRIIHTNLTEEDVEKAILYIEEEVKP